MSGLQSVASLEEPETYDRLLSMLESGGKMELYEAIRRLPGIEPRLTESVRRYFARITVHGREPAEKPEYHNPHGGRLALPLRHGLPEALNDALAVFRWENPVRKGTHSFATDIQSEFLLRFLIAPSNIEGRSRAACDFLAALKPEDCRFDLLTRRWITPGANP